METFNPDPKPGRIVLPLVLIGMIATTYTFINRVSTNNNLEIVAEETPVETVAEETSVEDTSTTTTTTTLPDNYVAYLEELSAEKIQATELGKDVLEANDNWDNQSVTYQEAKDEFKKRLGGRSCDLADAFCLTFAQQSFVASVRGTQHNWNKPIQYKDNSWIT